MNRNTEPQIGHPSLKKRILNIEFLRFFLAWVIVIGHIVNYTTLFGFENWTGYVSNFATSVEMFFVIGFFFLVLKTNEKQSIIEFSVQKWLRLVPLVIAITGIGYVMHFFGFGHWSTSSNINNILLLYGWVETSAPGPFVPQAWYCSTFFGVSLFYLGIIKSFSNKTIPIVIAVLCYIGVRYMSDSFTLLYSGVCRALFALGIGYFLARAQQTYHIKVTGTKSRILYTIAECILSFLIIQHLMFGMYNVLSTIQVVLAFSCLFWLFINKAGYISLFFEKNWCACLGRYSYSLFIVHMFVCQMFMSIIRRGYGDWCSHNPLLLFSIMCLVSAILAMIGHHFVELPILRYAHRMKEKN